MFSRRTARDQAPNAIAAWLKGAPRPRFDLTSSNPTTVGLSYPDELLKALERAQSRALTYQPEPFGSREAREALVPLVGGSAADILLTASTSEAYGFLFKLLCDAGDAVLIPAPSYPLFEHLAELEAVEPRSYRLAYDGAWHLDLDSVRRALTAKTRAIVVVSPNNPSGHYTTQSELDALAQFGLPLICDRVFAEFPLDRAPPAPLRAPNDCLLFSLDGLSKRAGSPQLKLAWTQISGPEPLRRKARERLELIADTFLSVATPIQAALPDLLELAPKLTEVIAARCRSNLATLTSSVLAAPVTLLKPQAGWSAVLHLPAVQPEEQLVLGLLREQELLVQPGFFYDFEREPYAVVSLLSEPGTLTAGAARLVDYVRRL